MMNQSSSLAGLPNLPYEIFTPRVIIESLLTGPMSDKFFDMLRVELEQTIDDELGFTGRLMFIAGGRRYREMKSQLVEIVVKQVPQTTGPIEEYAQKHLDIETLMVEKMSELDAHSYENLLRPAFKDDEWLIVVAGAALGFICGEIQSQIILLLAR